MLPRDTITIVGTIQGNTDRIIVSTSTNTVINVRLQQSGTASETHLSCGASVGGLDIISNFGKDFPEVNMNYVCTSTLQVHKTGNDTSWYSVSYVPRDRKTSFDPVFSNSTTSVTVNTMDATTTAIYTSNLQLQTIIFPVVIFVFVVYIFYWLTRKFF